MRITNCVGFAVVLVMLVMGRGWTALGAALRADRNQAHVLDRLARCVLHLAVEPVDRRSPVGSVVSVSAYYGRSLASSRPATPVPDNFSVLHRRAQSPDISICPGPPVEQGGVVQFLDVAARGGAKIRFSAGGSRARLRVPLDQERVSPLFFLLRTVRPPSSNLREGQPHASTH